MIRDLLNRLQPIARGVRLASVMTVDRIDAIQKLILGLWRGDNITVGPGLKKGYGINGIRIDLVARNRRGGGGGSDEIRPLDILASRPKYIPVPQSPPEEGAKRYYIQWGSVNDKLAENYEGGFDVFATTYFFAKATFAATEAFRITTWEIKTGAEYDTEETPDWAVGAARPDYMIVLLGRVFVDATDPDNKIHTIYPNGRGSLLLAEHINSLSPGTNYGDVSIGKQLTYSRLL